MNAGDRVRVYGGRKVCRSSGTFTGGYGRHRARRACDSAIAVHTGIDVTHGRGGHRFPLCHKCWPHGGPTKDMSRDELLVVGIVVTQSDGHSRMLCEVKSREFCYDEALWDRLDGGRRRSHLSEMNRERLGVPEYGGSMDVDVWLRWCRKKGAMAVVP